MLNSGLLKICISHFFAHIKELILEFKFEPACFSAKDVAPEISHNKGNQFTKLVLIMVCALQYGDKVDHSSTFFSLP